MIAKGNGRGSRFPLAVKLSSFFAEIVFIPPFAYLATYH
jgi:hypothetical protein